MGLVRWHVLHLLALSATFVGAAQTTDGLESPIFQLFPVAGLLWVTYFPEDRASLAVAPAMATTLIVWTWLGDGLPIDYSLLDGATTVIASILIPLFALRLVETELLHRRRAVVDQLTGCLNRHALASRTTELQAQLELNDETVGVVVFDIDHFKSINDTHGHHFGDRTLVEVTRAVRNRLRRFELFYRIGGEEFVVLLAGADEHDSLQLADGLRDAVRATVIGQTQVTISCGVTVASKRLDIDRALELADKAMYTAKRKGRDRTVFLDDGERGGTAVEM
jgi:diguanylate cyclase (GGDEF)-like protein